MEFECKTESALNHLTNTSRIPVIIIAFNNISYVKNMLNQLREKKVKNEDIWIWDNNSTYPPLLEFYEQEGRNYHLIKNNENYGPHFFTHRKFSICCRNFLPSRIQISLFSKKCRNIF